MMEFYTRISQKDGAFGTAKFVVIKSFRKVTIFTNDVTKIVYMHADDDFTVEKIGNNIDPDEAFQVVMGPRASEIIQTMLESEKKSGSTMIWTGARFLNSADTNILRDKKSICRDPLCRDFIESESERKVRLQHEREQQDPESMDE